MSLPEVHRQVCDWFRLEAAKEMLLRELMSVPERVRPAYFCQTSIRRQLASLSNYAVDFRYPGDSASRRQALTALRHAKNIRQEIRTRLGLPT